MLRQFPNLNQVPEEILKTIPPLEEGEVVTFQSLVTATDYDAEFGTSKTVYPPVQLPTRDIIKVKKDGKTINVPIGIPKTVDNDKVIEWEFFMPGNSHSLYSGRFSFTGGNIEQEEKYYFYMLSNLRKDNPFRDKNITPLYELIDNRKTAEQVRKTTNNLRLALNIVDGMTDGECDDFAAAMNWPYQSDKTILKADIEEYATNEPQAFLDNFSNKGKLEIKSILKRAEEKGFIKYDTNKNRVMWVKGNAIIITLEPEEGKDWLELFSDWVRNSANGAQVFKSIKSKINKVDEE